MLFEDWKLKYRTQWQIYFKIYNISNMSKKKIMWAIPGKVNLLTNRWLSLTAYNKTNIKTSMSTSKFTEANLSSQEPIPRKRNVHIKSSRKIQLTIEKSRLSTPFSEFMLFNLFNRCLLFLTVKPGLWSQLNTIHYSLPRSLIQRL